LSKTKAGWLVGIFFAAYVVMVPVFVALTDRIPVRRVFMLGTGLPALSHFGFTLFADANRARSSHNPASTPLHMTRQQLSFRSSSALARSPPVHKGVHQHK
jgi:MFS family permease